MKRVLLIGAGIHYREKYHTVLTNHEIVMVVDLKSQEKVIREFFGDYPIKYLFLDESYRNTITSFQIEKLIGKIEVDAVLICTEPKVRAEYALWAARRGFAMFLDKPATIDLASFDVLLSMNPKAVVSCERRVHKGYKLLFQIIDTFTERFGVPLTNIDIHYGGGVWHTLHEYCYEENHPFQYGYGVLMHSGYHYVDLLASFLKYGKGNEITMHAVCSTPKDYINLCAPHEFSHLGYKNENVPNLEGFGESDVHAIGQLKCEGMVSTNFSLKLLGTTLSTRSKVAREEKLPGRIRQEIVILHFGHLMSIQINSTQLKRIDSCRFSNEQFEITILRNPLVGGSGVERIQREDITEERCSLNTAARQWQLSDFLQGGDGCSSLESHRTTMDLIESIREAIHSHTPQPSYCFT